MGKGIIMRWLFKQPHHTKHSRDRGLQTEEVDLVGTEGLWLLGFTRGTARQSTGPMRAYNGTFTPRAGRQPQSGRGNYACVPKLRYTCGEEGHTAAQCFSRGDGYFMAVATFVENGGISNIFVVLRKFISALMSLKGWRMGGL